MIMQLVDEGRLSLDAAVADVLPGARLGSPDVSSAVTVRHLLTHTSGVDGDIFTDTGRGADCIERYAELLAGAALTHPVGAAYSYCNSGFVLLGRIIEVLDGREWDACLRRRLIEPLGLTQTVTLPEEAIMHRAAVGHRPRPRDDEPVPVWMLPRSIGPAGLIISSAHDVLTFARMHLDGGVAGGGTRLLAAGSAAAMRRQQFAIPAAGPGQEAIGLGWRLYQWGDRPVFGHDGSTVGQNAFLRVDPRSGVAVCLLTNASLGDPLYQAIVGEVLGEYAGVRLPASPEPVAMAADADLARHVGRYERTSRRFDVSVRDGRLHAVVTPTGQLAAMRDADPEEFDLYPADSSGESFVCRSFDDEPWTAVSFGRLADQTPYMYVGGRITLRA